MTSLVFGPFEKPLSVDMRDRVDGFITRAQRRGFSLIVNETDEAIKVTAVDIQPKIALVGAEHCRSDVQATSALYDRIKTLFGECA